MSGLASLAGLVSWSSLLCWTASLAPWQGGIGRPPGGSFRAVRGPARMHLRERCDEDCPTGRRSADTLVARAERHQHVRDLIRQWRTDVDTCVQQELLAEEGRLMSVSKRLLALMSALVVAILVLAGCGGGGASSSSGGTLSLGNIGWDEDVAVANLTKVVLE